MAIVVGFMTSSFFLSLLFQIPDLSAGWSVMVISHLEFLILFILPGDYAWNQMHHPLTSGGNRTKAALFFSCDPSIISTQNLEHLWIFIAR